MSVWEALDQLRAEYPELWEAMAICDEALAIYARIMAVLNPVRIVIQRTRSTR